MENICLHFMAFLTTFSLLNRYCSSAGVLCSSPQNGTLGGVGIIQCSFESDFNTIVWSYAEDSGNPLIRYNRNRKFPNLSVLQGPGHDDQSYSIRIDGALLIFDVARRPESKEYMVEMVDDEDHWEQNVVYQFVGESTGIHHQSTVSPTTCPVTETTRSGESTSYHHPTSESPSACPVIETPSSECAWKPVGIVLLLLVILLVIIVGILAMKICRQNKPGYQSPRNRQDLPLAHEETSSTT